MILFYRKKTGEVYAVMDGRVHNEQDLNSYVEDKDGARYIIGWTEKDGKKVEHNMQDFPLLQKFEDLTAVSPMDYKIVNGKLIKKDETTTKS